MTLLASSIIISVLLVEGQMNEVLKSADTASGNSSGETGAVVSTVCAPADLPAALGAWRGSSGCLGPKVDTI